MISKKRFSLTILILALTVNIGIFGYYKFFSAQKKEDSKTSIEYVPEFKCPENYLSLFQNKAESFSLKEVNIILWRDKVKLGEEEKVGDELAQKLKGKVTYSANPLHYSIETPATTSENLLNILQNLEKDERIKRASTSAYSTPPDDSKIINDGGSRYPINQVLIRLNDDLGRDIAQEIAEKVCGRIIGFAYSVNLYTFEIPVQSKTELEKVINILKTDTRISGVMRNIEPGLN